MPDPFREAHNPASKVEISGMHKAKGRKGLWDGGGIWDYILEVIDKSILQTI